MNTKLKLSCALIIPLCISLICIAGTAFVVSSEDVRPDIVVTGITTPESLYPDYRYTIGATVENIGECNITTPFNVSLHVNETVIGNETVNALSAGETSIINFTWTPLSIGSYNLTATADTDNAVNESNETNNTCTKNITVIKDPKPDLIVTEIGMPQRAYANISNTITATVGNIGNVNTSTPFKVRFVLNDTILCEKTVTTVLAAAANTSISFDWTPTHAGSYTITMIADPDDEIVELDETNNENSSDVAAFLISETELVITEVKTTDTICADELNPVRVLVKNLGRDTGDFNVTLYANGKPLGTKRVPSLAWGAVAVAVFGWVPGNAGNYTLNATESKTNDRLEVDVLVAPAPVWNHTANITIAHSGAPLTDHQILLTLDPSIFNYNLTGDDGRDIAFRDGDESGDPLPYWTPEWNRTGESRIRIRLNVSPGGKTITMLYGNSSVSSGSDGYLVFDFYDDFEAGLYGWQRDAVLYGDGDYIITIVDDAGSLDGSDHAARIEIKRLTGIAGLYRNMTLPIPYYFDFGMMVECDAGTPEAGVFIGERLAYDVPKLYTTGAESPWATHSIDLSNWTGQTVGIGFYGMNSWWSDYHVNISIDNALLRKKVDTEPFVDYGYADIAPITITPRFANLYANFTNQIYATVGNDGTANARNVSVAFSVDGAEVDSCEMTIPYRSDKAVEFEWNPPVEGDYTLTVAVDTENSVDETCETNNNLTLDVSVNPELVWGCAFQEAVYLRPIGTEPVGDTTGLLTLDPSIFDYTKANPDGSDIRIKDGDGSDLSYWIERWNASGESAIFFGANISRAGKTVYLCYGNSSAQSESDASAVTILVEDWEGGDASLARWNFNWSHTSGGWGSRLIEDTIIASGSRALMISTGGCGYCRCDNQRQVGADHGDFVFSGWLYPEQLRGVDAYTAYIIDVNVSGNPYHLWYGAFNYEPVDTSDTFHFPLFTADSGWHHLSRSLREDLVGKGIDVTCEFSVENVSQCVHATYIPNSPDGGVATAYFDCLAILQHTYADLGYADLAPVSIAPTLDQFYANCTRNPAIITIENNGTADARNFNISLSIDCEPPYRENYAEVCSILHKDRLSIAFNWTPPHAGNFTARVAVDSEGVVNETDRSNNNQTFELHVADELPDLTISDIGIPAEVPMNRTLEIDTVVANLGSGVGAFNLSFSVDGAVVLNRTVDALESRENRTVNLSWHSGSSIGNHTLAITLDPDDEIGELDEENNDGTQEVAVVAPDLTLAVTEPSGYYINCTNRINVAVTNSGTAQAGYFNVTFHANSSMEDVKRIGPLDKNETTELSFDWTPPEYGNRTLTIEVDGENEIEESDETNNNWTMEVSVVDAPESEIAITSVTTKNRFYANTANMIHVTIENVGNRIESFNVTLSEDGVPVVVQRVDDLPERTETSIRFAWVPRETKENLPKNCTLVIEADSGGEVNESDETNNMLEIGVVALEYIAVPPSPALIRGNASYEDGKSCTDFSAEITKRNETFAARTFPGFSYYNAILWLFQSDTYPEPCMIRVNATDGGSVSVADHNMTAEEVGRGGVVLNVTIPFLLPDINVTRIDLPEPCYINRTYTVNTTIENIGTDMNLNQSFNVSFLVDGVAVGVNAIGSLNYSETAKSSFEWTPDRAGSYDLTIFADSDQEIAEAAEYNNNLTITGASAIAPDLLIEGILINGIEPPYDDVFVNRSNTVDITINNTGTADVDLNAMWGEYFSVTLLVTKGDATTTIMGSVSQLNESESKVVSLSWTPAETGAYTLRALIDSGDAIDESNETNNEFAMNRSVCEPTDLGMVLVSGEGNEYFRSFTAPLNCTAYNATMKACALIGEWVNDSTPVVIDGENITYVAGIPEPQFYLYNTTGWTWTESDANVSSPQLSDGTIFGWTGGFTPPPLPLADVTPTEITMPRTLYLGRMIPVTVTIENNGMLDASSLEVRLDLKHETWANRTQDVASDVVSVDAGGNATVTLKWLAEASGEYEVRVILDPSNHLNETCETNNEINMTARVIRGLIIDVPRDFRTIQEAVEDAAPDTVIYVHEGWYGDDSVNATMYGGGIHITFTDKKNISLIGDGWATEVDDASINIHNSSGIVIDGFNMVRGAHAGNGVHITINNSDDVVINDCNLHERIYGAVLLYNSSSCRISDCLIHYEGGYENSGPQAYYGHAIYIAADSRDNLIINNTVCQIPLGIRVEGDNNRIYHNNLYQTHFDDVGTPVGTGSRRRIIASDSGRKNGWDYNYWARYCTFCSCNQSISDDDDCFYIDDVCYTNLVRGGPFGLCTNQTTGEAWAKAYDMLDADGNGIRDLPYSAPDPQYGDPVIDRYPLTEPYGVDMDARIVGVVVPNRVYANRTNAIFAIVKRTTRDVEPRTFEIAGFANNTKIGNETITLDGYLTAEELGHYAKLTWVPNATGSYRINATVTSEILDVDSSNNLMELDLDVLEPPFEPRNLGSLPSPSGSKFSPAWCSIAACAMGTDPHEKNWFDERMKQYMWDQFELGTATALRNAGGWAIWTLGIVAAGEDPRNFGGVNYLGMLESYYNGESMGSVETGDVAWDDAMALLAFDAAEVEDCGMITNVRNDLIGRQKLDGSWFFKYHSEGGKASHTAIVVQALLVSGVNKSSIEIRNGLEYLNKSINDDGSFPYRTEKYTGESQDVLATSHAIQAILAAGENPLDWNGSDTTDTTPVDYLSTPNPLQEKHLFTVPGVFNTTNASNASEFETALCNGTIPDSLEAMFEDDGRPLTEAVSVTNSTEEDDAWILTDDGNEYVLMKNGDDLVVCVREVELSSGEQAARIPALLGEPYPVARLIMQEEPRVDLRPISIDAPYRIYNRTNCTINGIIRNSGGASPATLLANGVPVDDSTTKSVWAKGATEIDFEWKPKRSGEYNLTIASDYYNKVNETDETNNMRTIFVTVANPDLEPDMRLRSNTVNVTNVIDATVYGTTDESFNVTFLVGNRTINTTRIHGIDESTSLTFYWMPNETRYYNLTVFADSDTEVEESDETNNYLTKHVPAIKPELSVRSLDVPTIYSNATNPVYLDIGGVASAFNVSLFVNGTNETNETLVCKQMIESLWAEEDLKTTLYWEPNRTGRYDVRVFVDSDDDEDEQNETNNNKTIPVDVILPDLIPQEIATPAHIYYNETNTINITITNAGDDFNVTLIADGGYVWNETVNETVNATNGTANETKMTKTPVNATVIRKYTNVSFYGSTTLSFDWIPKRLGICNLAVLVDPDCDLYESDETNNNLTREVHVVEHVPIELLSPRGGEIWADTENIEWNTTFQRNLIIDIDYSPNKGGRWEGIVRDTDDDGSYAWNTTDVPDGYDYLIKVMANGEDAYGEDISNKFAVYNTWSAEAWEEFHANAGFSLSTAPDSAALAWASNEIDANPSSSVGVADGKVFVYCDSGKVMCLGEDDGVELWAADVGSGGGLDSWATPVYSKGKVYMVGSGSVGLCNNSDGDPSPDDSIKAFVLSTIDAETGATTKKYYLVNKTDASGVPVNGGVLVADGTQFFSTYDDGLYYRVGDGVDDVNPRSAPIGMRYCGDAPIGYDWQFEVDGIAQSTPVAAFDSIYFGSYAGVDARGGVLYRVNRGTGSEIWNLSLASGVCGSPTVVNGNVYLTTYGFYKSPSGTYVFDAESGNLVWDHAWEGGGYPRPSDSTPAYAPFDDGYVYVAGGGWADSPYVVCFDDLDGSIVWDDDASNFSQWVNDSSQYDEPFGIGHWTNSPVVSIDEKVFVGKPAEGGVTDYIGLFCLNATTGKERWHSKFGGSTAAIANGRVYTTGEGRVYAFGTVGSIDLVPREITVVDPPAYEKVETLINVTVENIGTEDAGGFDVSLGYKGAELGTASVGSLARGGIASVTFRWTPPAAGNYTLQVTVNEDMRVNENLFNNRMDKDVTVLSTPPADIAVTSLTANDNPVLTDKPCTIEATIINYGEPASDFYVSLTANGNPVGSPIRISDLSYMKSKIVSFIWIPPASGTYTLTVFADCYNTTIESDETNNTMQIQVTALFKPIPTPTPIGLEDGAGGGRGGGSGNHVWRDAEGDGADESEAVTSGAQAFVNETESPGGGEKKAKGFPMGTKFLSGGGGGGTISLAILIAALILLGLLIYGTRKERERYRKARR